MTFTLEITINDIALRTEAREWLDNHFMSSYFNISLIDKMIMHLNIEGVKPSRIYTYLRSLHCVNFDKMKPVTLGKCKEICYGLIGETVEIGGLEYEDLV